MRLQLTSHDYADKCKANDSQQHQNCELDAFADLVASPLLDTVLAVPNIEVVGLVYNHQLHQLRENEIQYVWP